MIILYLMHEYVSKNFIPRYRLKYDAREAAKRFIETFENHPESFVN